EMPAQRQTVAIDDRRCVLRQRRTRKQKRCRCCKGCCRARPAKAWLFRKFHHASFHVGFLAGTRAITNKPAFANASPNLLVNNRTAAQNGRSNRSRNKAQKPTWRNRMMTPWSSS